MYKKVDHPEKLCIECGEMFKPKMASSHYCGDKCRNRRTAREYRKANPDKAKAKSLARRGKIIKRKYTLVCKGCGKDYNPVRSGTSYCTRECAFKNRDMKGIGKTSCRLPLYSRIYIKACTICSKPFISKYDKTNVCSSECRKVDVEIKRIEGLNNRRSSHSCPVCNVAFCPLGGGKICTSCLLERAAKAAKKHKRIRRHKVRATKAGVRFDKFDPLDVLSRDRWTCRGCGCSTPQELRGTIEDDAPELDHVIPLARGGEHTVENTQCLCRVCNIMKSDKTMSEFIQWNQ